MPSTSIGGIPYPDGSTKVGQWPAAILDSFESLEQKLVLVFADAAARNAAIPSPSEGMVAYLTTPKQYTMYDGTGWVILAEPAQSWSNPFTGITGGSPSFTGWYKRGDGLCTFRGRLTLGGTPSVFAPVLALPITGETNAIGRNIFNIGLRAAAGNCPGGLDGSGSVLALNCASTYGAFGSLSTTVPATWVSGDWIDVYGCYRMASRYS